LAAARLRRDEAQQFENVTHRNHLPNGLEIDTWQEPVSRKSSPHSNRIRTDRTRHREEEPVVTFRARETDPYSLPEPIDTTQVTILRIKINPRILRKSLNNAASPQRHAFPSPGPSDRPSFSLKNKVLDCPEKPKPFRTPVDRLGAVT
jgi:hypothetical protein